MTEQIVTSRRAIPPPFDLDLIDGVRRVGWLTRETMGFGGFANETEAMHAAWVAHRTLARRLAQREGRRPIPIDIEPLTLRADESIYASGRAIAALVRPASASMSGPDSFGFELTLPSLDETTARSKALMIYRALRRSGVRWAMWTTDVRRARRAAVPRSATSEAPVSHTSPFGLVASTVALSLVFLILALFAPEPIGATLAAIGLAGLLAIRLSLMGVGPSARLRAMRARS